MVYEFTDFSRFLATLNSRISHVYGIRNRTFRRHRLGTDRFGAGTSRRWDISEPAVTAPDVSALVLTAVYTVAAAVATLHSDTNNTSGT